MPLQTAENPIKHRFSDFGKDRINVAEWTIRIRDAYNLPYIYMMVHDWMQEEGWVPREDHFFPETFYIQRDNPALGKEIWIRWRCTRFPPGAKSSFFTYAIDLDWKLVGLKEVEISWKGQKVKADRAEFELICRAALIIDKTKEWSTWPLAQIKNLYSKRMLRQKGLMHEKNIYADAYRLRDMVMNYLKLETFMPVKEAGEFYLKRTLE